MKKSYCLLCVLLLLFSAGCDWFDTDDENGNGLQEHDVTDTYTWTAADFTQLEVRSINGDISAGAVFGTDLTVVVTRRVSGPDENEIETRIDSITIDTSRTNGHLTVMADMPNYDGYNYSADFEILAPPDITLMLVTVNGNLSADGYSTEGLLNTTNGNITVENQNGAVDAYSVNGNLTCEILTLPASSIVTMATVNGNATLNLPGDVSTYFMASTIIGEVEVLGFDDVTYVDFEKNKKSGNIGAGDAIVYLTVTNGNITLFGWDQIDNQ